MALRSTTNPYPGINIHLNNYLQANPDTWRSFHSNFITNLREHLDQVLPESYFAVTTPSLQLGELLSNLRVKRSAYIYPDQISIPHTLYDQDKLMSVAILHLSPDFTPPNLSNQKKVAHIELLFASSKIDGSHHAHYINCRQTYIKRSISLIEIDFLHMTPPVIPNVPAYPEDNAKPFQILMTLQDDGTTYIYESGVHESIPHVRIPLDNRENVTVDFNIPYNDVFESTRFYNRRIVDYGEPPINLDSFTPNDKRKIDTMLADIRKNLSTQH